LGGSNSAGRVRPCQGRCRRFESGLPLHISSFPTAMNNRLVLLPVVLPLFAFSAFAQDYKLEPVAAAAPDLPAAYASAIQAQGFRVNGGSGAWCEVWLAKTLPVGAKPDDAAISFGIAPGTLIRVIRLPGKGADRRGHVIPGRVYNPRYRRFPVDGAHSGVAPPRDFA